MAQNWNFDPANGDYKMSGGAPEQTDSLLIPAYIRMKTPRGRWMYAPDNQYGSDLFSARRRQSSTDPTLIENIIARSLQPLADDGRARRISVTSTNLVRGKSDLSIYIQKKSGEVEGLDKAGFGV